MEQLVNFIIRPPRAEYSPEGDLLDQEFMLKGRWYQRKDLEITNSRGHVLQCTHYLPLGISEDMSLPCVIYCHGNSGCRADASEAAIILLPSNITVFTLDFSGSGISEGEYVTLGCNEKDDLKAVVSYLRTNGNVSCIGLWGRSMGAVTSLMYGAEDPSIAGMVLDSPFSNLVELMMELVDTYKYPFPKFTVKIAIKHMQKIIKKKANFNIMDLDAIQVAKCCFVPVLFGHATGDDFIHPHHSDRIYESYVGDKNIIKFDGDHNSPRPQFYFDSITIFFHNVLNPPSDEQCYHTKKDNSSSMSGTSNGHHKQYSEPGSESTEETINELRSRRPMSRTEVPADISTEEQEVGNEGNGTQGSSNNHSHCLADEEYFEFSVDDDFSDIPSSMEDEERMLMEAIMESLKDMQQNCPQENTATSSNPNETSPDSAHGTISETKETESTVEPESSTIEPQTTAECSTVNDCSSSKDVSEGTKPALDVKSNSSNNIIEGLTHRWGLNFFKSKSMK